MMKTEHRVQSYIATQHLLEDGQRVLVALSGGADSVCLLLLMRRLGYDCVAAHCNFHLRGDESDRDENFVTELCERLHVQLHKIDFDTKTYAQTKGISIEMAAREMRYDYFHSIASQEQLDTVCIAHHRDDSAETFLLNAVRGTGIAGLSGISAKRLDGELHIVRPLLCLSRKEILEYLEDNRQAFVTDSSNLVDDVARNKVRLDVVPILRQINPAAVENLSTTMENLLEVQRVYESAIASDLQRCETARGILSVELLLTSVSPVSVLYSWLYSRGFNRAQVYDILEAIRNPQSGKIFKSDSDCVLVDRGSLVLESAMQYVRPEDISMTVLPRGEVAIKRNPHYAYLDADKVAGNLNVRLVQTSDSFQPFGMHGRKLVSDFLTDCKLNLFQKRHQLVVCDSSDIAWVVGLRASEKYRVDEKTKRVVVLEIVGKN